MANFSEERFDADWTAGARGGPEFNTYIVASSSGYEYSNANWQDARYSYDIGNQLLTASQKDYITSFFQARKGRHQGFRLKDWADYIATEQTIGVGNGTATVFQLYKNYVTSLSTTNRKITKPVSGTLVIKVNGVVTVAFTPNYTTGTITFASAPPNGHPVTASFEFDVPVRFDIDRIDFIYQVIQGAGLYNVDSIPLVELKL